MWIGSKLEQSICTWTGTWTIQAIHLYINLSIQVWSCYRASMAENVKRFSECTSRLNGLSTSVIRLEYVGCFGLGKVAPSLLNIETTSDMVGLSSAQSWTHKSPTWMQSSRLSVELESANVESINSTHCPDFHKFHAFNNFHILTP